MVLAPQESEAVASHEPMTLEEFRARWNPQVKEVYDLLYKYIPHLVADRVRRQTRQSGGGIVTVRVVPLGDRDGGEGKRYPAYFIEITSKDELVLYVGQSRIKLLTRLSWDSAKIDDIRDLKIIIERLARRLS